MDKKTILEWEEHFETFVMDGDGFPQGTVKNKTLFTQEEFVKNTRISTVKMSEKLTKAWEQSPL